MSYLAKVKLLTDSGEVIIPKSAKENNTRVLAYDVETGEVVTSFVKEVKGSLLSNVSYVSTSSPLGGRNKSLELTLEHHVLVEVDRDLKYMSISKVMDLVERGVEARLLSFNKESFVVSTSGNVLYKGDLVESFPATFAEDIILEESTYIPVVSFDSGRTNFVL